MHDLLGALGPSEARRSCWRVRRASLGEVGINLATRQPHHVVRIRYSVRRNYTTFAGAYRGSSNVVVSARYFRWLFVTACAGDFFVADLSDGPRS